MPRELREKLNPEDSVLGFTRGGGTGSFAGVSFVSETEVGFSGGATGFSAELGRARKVSAASS